MIQYINHITPAADAKPYNPAKTVTVGANDSYELTLQGRGSDVFGINRILPWASDLDALKITARINHERILFEDIRLPVIRELFSDSKLKAPFIIHKNNELTLTLENTSSGDVPVNIELLGYDGPNLRKLVSLYKQKGFPMPTPVFLYGGGTVNANAANQRINIPTKSKDVLLERMAIHSGKDELIHVSLQVYNETIKNDVFVNQINDEFAGGRRALVPITIKKSVPFTLAASNVDTSDHWLSYMGEAYVLDNANA
jgi:hypothetical protein